MDERRHAFMRELERALLEAISESTEFHRTLDRMHREGFTLRLSLDCLPAAEPTAAPVAASFSTEPLEPAFRINSDDLALLRGLGIDPTRKSRARK